MHAENTMPIDVTMHLNDSHFKTNTFFEFHSFLLQSKDDSPLKSIYIFLYLNQGQLQIWTNRENLYNFKRCSNDVKIIF